MSLAGDWKRDTSTLLIDLMVIEFYTIRGKKVTVSR